MKSLHDPIKQAANLHAVLSADKRPLAFLIGAGCPQSVRIPDGTGTKPLLPEIVGLTKLIDEKLASTPAHAAHLTNLKKQLADDGHSAPSVEDYLNHVRGLRQIAGNATVRGFGATDLEKLDAEICAQISHAMDAKLPNRDSPYHHLSSWVGSASRLEPVEIFTTNYDLLMETAFEEQRVPYFDGFVGGVAPFFDLRSIESDAMPQRWARLWKIHGSINWSKQHDGTVVRVGPVSAATSRLIHPSHLKYQESRRMPYLALMDRLRTFLRRPSAFLIVSGFSFRDEHINEVIVQGLESNSTAAVFGLLYGGIANYQKATELAKAHKSLTLLAEDGGVLGGQSELWPEREAASLPDAPPISIEWKDVVVGKTKRPLFALGSFERLGALLKRLQGER